MEATELDKARLLRNIENLRRDTERQQEMVDSHLDRIREYETEALLIFTYPDNFDPDFAPAINQAPEMSPWNGSYSEASIRRHMKASPRTRFFELISLRDRTLESVTRLKQQIATNEEIIAGYEYAISSATDTQITTVEQVQRAQSEFQQQIQDLKDQFRDTRLEYENMKSRQNFLFDMEEYYGGTTVNFRRGNRGRYRSDLNEEGRIRYDAYQVEIDTLWDDMKVLQEQIADLESIADEGEYL